MNIVRKFKPAPAVNQGDDEIAALEQRISELDLRDAAITKQILTLEKTAGSAKINPSAENEAAEALLGGAKFERPREQPISQLTALHTERGVLRRALDIGRKRLDHLREARAAEIWKSHFAEIAEIEKRRVLLALELQKINRKRETLREKITAAGGAGYLTTDGADLLGLGDRHDEVSWGVDRLIADGVASAAEIDRAKAEG